MILTSQSTVWGSDEKGHDTKYAKATIIGTRSELEELHKALGDFLARTSPENKQEVETSEGNKLAFLEAEKPYIPWG